MRSALLEASGWKNVCARGVYIDHRFGLQDGQLNGRKNCRWQVVTSGKESYLFNGHQPETGLRALPKKT
jgi:hypothetical protein